MRSLSFVPIDKGDVGPYYCDQQKAGIKVESLRVIDLLFAPNMDEARIAAGWRGLTRCVTSFTVAGEPDVADWLHGGEAVLSTAFFVKNDIAATLKWIESLADRNAACLGLKVGRFMGSVPFEVLELCNHKDLPLLLLPDHTRWSSLLKSLFQFEVSRSAVVLELEPIRDLLLGHLADDPPHRLSSMLDTFYAETDIPTLLMRSDGVIVAQASTHNSADEDEWRDYIAKMHFRSSSELTLPGSGTAFRIEPAAANLWLIVPELPNTSLPPLRLLLNTMGGFLPYSYSLAQQSHLISTIICSDQPPVLDVVEMSKLRLSQPGYAVVANIDPQTFSYRAFQESIVPQLGPLLSWHFVNGNRLVMGLTVPRHSHQRPLGKTILDPLYQTLNAKGFAQTLGVGPLSRTVDQYRLSYRLAGIIAESSWAPSLKSPAFFVETAIYLSCGLQKHSPLKAYVKEYLRPFFDEANQDLVLTLKTLLENKMSVTVTAQQLFLHPNTVKYRLTKIQDLLDVDMAAPACLSTMVWLLGILELNLL